MNSEIGSDPIKEFIEDIASHTTPSIPQPKPKNEGFPIPMKLIEDIDRQDGLTIGQKLATVSLIQERSLFGYNKYGQLLMSEDGRDAVEDARQEFGDLLQYLYKAKVNGKDLSIFQSYLPILVRLLDS